MPSVTAADKDIPHVLVDIIDTSDHRGEKAASGHDYVNILQRNSTGFHEVLDSLTAHVALVHDGLVLGHLVGGMFKLLVKDAYPV